MTPAYSAQQRNSSSFHDEDFPALVSKIRPLKHAAGNKSAWSNHTAAAKAQPLPPPPSRPSPPLSSVSSGPQLLSSSSSSSNSSLSLRRKKMSQEKEIPTRSPPPPSRSDGVGGSAQQEYRSVPTMLEISSLLTVKGGKSKPSAAAPDPPNPTPMPDPFTSKASKKKKQQKNTAAAASPPPSSTSGTTQTVETAAQKENVPEKSWNKAPPPAGGAGTATLMANGHPEKSPPVRKEAVAAAPRPKAADPPPEQEEEEDFPALMTKKPPPGFKSSFPLKASAPAPAPAPASVMPPPPPGLGISAPKPPPGFTGIPLNSNVVEPAAPAVNPPPKVSSTAYLVPDDFNQRNLELIQSIRMYLHNDESTFNEFKNYSAQFRQSVISAVQYHGSCKDLLGEDFNRIFNELLVLLPDTGKQQELLSAHGDSRALEKQSGAGGGKKNKNKKNAWQMPTSMAAELDCQVCPTCRQVLAPKDFNSHKTMHIRDNEDFPSLQSISRIIS
ncbi:Zinc finger protein 598 [Liparis tanakae]|uniref:Zinc finger protein 598 n=1 Tax=Liparis tanakae TaxID=230148 RepID=A0A4Z2FR89_9TELE|nr:Zinc finger protein 598 [Liparis tanakae]